MCSIARLHSINYYKAGTSDLLKYGFTLSPENTSAGVYAIMYFLEALYQRFFVQCVTDACVHSWILLKMAHNELFFKNNCIWSHVLSRLHFRVETRGGYEREKWIFVKVHGSWVFTNPGPWTSMNFLILWTGLWFVGFMTCKWTQPVSELRRLLNAFVWAHSSHAPWWHNLQDSLALHHCGGMAQEWVILFSFSCGYQLPGRA